MPEKEKGSKSQISWKVQPSKKVKEPVRLEDGVAAGGNRGQVRPAASAVIGSTLLAVLGGILGGFFRGIAGR